MTLSLMPIGAYAPRWFMERVHIDPDEALQASLTLESQTTLAIHFATFNLADDAYDAPTQALARAVSHLVDAPPGSDFRVLPFGEAAIVRRGEGREEAGRRRYA
jgi:L-ascorbate metabolism protein UlaG (beta-lactamase superfamily)